MVNKIQEFFKIPLWKLLLQPESLTKEIQEIKFFCYTCHKHKTLKFFPDKVTVLCGCGCTIIYYPSKKNKDNFVGEKDYCVQFVSKEEYDRTRRLTYAS